MSIIIVKQVISGEGGWFKEAVSARGAKSEKVGKTGDRAKQYRNRVRKQCKFKIQAVNRA